MYSLISDNPIESLSVPVNKDCDQLVEIFNAVFSKSHNTRLVKGAQEPLYRPADEEQSYHSIEFTQNYFASALHEIAHWCVAGEARRQQLDYGYWYAPDGRSEAQQSEFERVEVAPQALEWMFSVAAGVKFRVSADNLAMGLGASSEFKDRIFQRVNDNCLQGVNTRAAAFIAALEAYYQRSGSRECERYARAALD